MKRGYKSRRWEGQDAVRAGQMTQELKAPRSSEHSNVAPLSLDVNENVGVALELGSLGFVPIDVVSTGFTTGEAVEVEPPLL